MKTPITCENNPKQDMQQMDTKQLLQLYKETGNEEIKWEIVLRYEHIIKSVAVQFRVIYSGFAQLDDIINEGLLTLLKAVDKFDPEKGVKFETYVSKRIRGMVVDLARKQDWVPRSVRKRAKKIDEVTTELCNKLGRYPTSAEVAECLEITEEKYQKELAYVAVNNMMSLEGLMDASESENISFQVPSDDESVRPDLVLEEQELKEVLTDAISRLQENEQIVLSLYYVENLLLREIAQVINVSEPRVSQIHTRAIGKLRKELMDYYNFSEGIKKKVKD